MVFSSSHIHHWIFSIWIDDPVGVLDPSGFRIVVMFGRCQWFWWESLSSIMRASPGEFRANPV